MTHAAHFSKISLNSVTHYENFPVASFLLPKRCVPAVQALYRFARTSDDIADEGTASISERILLLRDLLKQLEYPSNASTPCIQNLIPFIANGTLPIQYLRDLLTAFIQDAHQDGVYLKTPNLPRHLDMNSLLNYCTYSANPVGRLMLHIVGASCTPESFTASDHICTGLQLINFWQDVAKDQNANIPRTYIPQDIFLRYGSPSLTQYSADYAAMMHELCEDARCRMRQGFVLLPLLKGRFKAEIIATIAGGWLILNKLSACNYDVIQHRPTLTKRDLPAGLKLIWQLYRGNLK
jgi:squalene synthase HpnC